jgi:hypothetical protein
MMIEWEVLQEHVGQAVSSKRRLTNATKKSKEHKPKFCQTQAKHKKLTPEIMRKENGDQWGPQGANGDFFIKTLLPCRID